MLTLVESITDSGKNEGEELLTGDEESEISIASVEDQLRKEMTIYEVCKCLRNLFTLQNIKSKQSSTMFQKFIMGMLTNFGTMALERIHNTLKVQSDINLTDFTTLLS